ncbi:MAG TPA: hypothetical protein VGN39_10700 [Terriglobales bacterium]|nr:hypothetical protein [Terriglobales bacterium]
MKAPYLPSRFGPQIKAYRVRFEPSLLSNQLVAVFDEWAFMLSPRLLTRHIEIS